MRVRACVQHAHAKTPLSFALMMMGSAAVCVAGGGVTNGQYTMYNIKTLHRERGRCENKYSRTPTAHHVAMSMTRSFLLGGGRRRRRSRRMQQVSRMKITGNCFRRRDGERESDVGLLK